MEMLDIFSVFLFVQTLFQTGLLYMMHLSMGVCLLWRSSSTRYCSAKSIWSLLGSVAECSLCFTLKHPEWESHVDQKSICNIFFSTFICLTQTLHANLKTCILGCRQQDRSCCSCGQPQGSFCSSCAHDQHLVPLVGAAPGTDKTPAVASIQAPRHPFLVLFEVLKVLKGLAPPKQGHSWGEEISEPHCSVPSKLVDLASGGKRVVIGNSSTWTFWIMKTDRKDPVVQSIPWFLTKKPTFLQKVP